MNEGKVPATPDRIAQVIALVRARLPADQHATLEAFVRAYYERVDPEDLAERDPADLFGAALSHWQFARKREPGTTKVRVFNPAIDEQGWQSTHTVVEVVTDDMPFLVDSVTMEVNRHGLTLHLFIHPLLAVTRTDGTLAALGASGGLRESFMHVEVDRVVEAGDREKLAADITRVLADVRAAVTDWKAMIERARSITADVEKEKPPLPNDELEEGLAFLRWLVNDHFTFLGYRGHELGSVDGKDVLRIVEGSGLGILRDAHAKEVASFSALPPEVRAYARRPELLVVTKSTSRSTVHRPGFLDYIGIKRFDKKGEVCGEHRIFGLFTHTAYSTHPDEIPLLRKKTAEIVRRAGFAPGSHAAKQLTQIIETYPRDELFQTDVDELYGIVMGILQLGERQRFRLFVRRDRFERFVTCLIYAPRETYNTDLRRKWQQILESAFNGSSSDFNVHLTESVLARILVTVRTTPGQIPPFDVHALEARLAAAARRWQDDLRDALIDAVGEARGAALYRNFQNAFPAAYREDVSPRAAVPDIELMAKVEAGMPLGMTLYRPPEAPPGALRFKMLRRGAPVTLSDALPMLERMGLSVIDEHPYRVMPATGDPIFVHDYGLQGPAGMDLEIESLHAVFEDAFARIASGEVENDDFNRLTLLARIPAEDIVVIRAYAKYMRQIGFPLSQPFIEATIANHAGMARMLVELFKLRFDPSISDSASSSQAIAKIQQIDDALDKVENLSEDRVLRQYLALILATLRTNLWRRDDKGVRRTFVSFKFDPSKVPGLPEPKPMFEIFVYSPRFEGVHLRGGKVARGGLRWSDRPEDFRTEILGLVKAQMVKNAVIVPTGSKGGFVLKRAPSPSDRDAFMKEGIACYQNYLRGLLDLTDNRVGDKVVPPPNVRRHDPDDPYLVVAADKGTATFSDYANGISAEYGFWLGDAFASGGSAGYDHKAMGITARGAWESVKRHFREMGVDIQTTPFSVVGIGDMSGDVFGNGMLLSRKIRLLAAFDHRHVFLDPSPDCEASFVERERMFKLPRSSWADYDAKLISKGGGVYPRSAKSISITPEVKAALSIESDTMTPTELIHALLLAPVDLLYNGGIGTYVKSTRETHAQVGDRANDQIRVNGRDLRCKVVGEGGNLGCTQLGRIEYATNGGRLYTDAIDNSAGVDTSDHEVNIKILLGLPIADGELTQKQRNALLATMTEEVGTLVLRDNYFQTQCISVTGRIEAHLLDAQQRFIQYLERAGKLNRALEFLPDDQEIKERKAAGKGLYSPERSVMLAYSKIWLFDEFVESTQPDDPWIATALVRYFPHALREKYASYMARHPLRREIIATHVVNSTINRVGSTYMHRLSESTGAKPYEVVRAYLLAREVFGFVALWPRIEGLDNVADDAAQAQMLIDVSVLLERGTTWFLRSRRLTDDMSKTIEHFKPRVATVSERLTELIDGEERSQVETRAGAYIAQRVPADLAKQVAALPTLYAVLDIVEIAGATKHKVETVAATYFDVAAKLDLGWLRARIAALPGDQHWQALARAAMLDDLSALQRTVTAAVIAEGGADASPLTLMETWREKNGRALERARHLVDELKASASTDASMLSVALRELRNLA
jgi:glutamate dehydrogenase